MPARKSAAIRGIGGAALLPPAVFAVHQLRYLLAYGGHAGTALQQSGHSYLHSVVPWLIGLIALTVGRFLRAIGQAFSGHRSLGRYSMSFVAMWLACAGALLTLFVFQELLEGMLATGHVAGLNGVFGYGGWWSVPAALCLGLVLAAWFHGARWVLEEITERRAPRRWTGSPARTLGTLRPREVRLQLPAPVAGGRSQRGPPRLCG